MDEVKNILQTRINPPPLRPDIISRHRIIKQLELARHASGPPQLVLVSAPAGYGKTTLVREWMDSLQTRAAWYTLNSNTELKSFWTHLVFALQKIQANLGRGALEMLRSPSVFPESPAGNQGILTPLVNDLFRLETPLHLVLDDYHLVEDTRIHEGMAFLIENMPPHLHLTVATRSDPPWPLSRWRSQVKIMEIRQSDLRFTREETTAFLRSRVGKLLDERQMDNIYQKTEGWVTALQLVASSLREKTGARNYDTIISGDHRQILSYLTEEVISSQPESVHDFLLKTSLLPWFSPSLCDAVTNRTDSRKVINQLAKENLFLIPLDEQGNWYRYHPLFAELLYYYLEARDASQIPHLHGKAGHWFLEAGEWREAIRHFLQGEHHQMAAQVMDQSFEQLWEGEEMSQLLQWLNSLPEELKAKFPRLLACQGLISLLLGNMDDARYFINLAEQHSKGHERQDDLSGLLAVVRTSHCIYTGELDQGLKQAEMALNLLPEDAYFWRTSAAIVYGDVKILAGDLEGAYAAFKDAYRWSKQYDNFMVTISAAMNIQKTLWLKGELPEARRFAQEMLLLAKEKGFSSMPRVGVIWLFLGDLLREEGRLEEAKRCVTRGISMCESEIVLAGISHIFQVMVCFSMGRHKEAMGHMGRLESMDREANLPAVARNLFLAWKARIMLAKGDVAEAKDVLQAADTKNLDTICFPGAIQLVNARRLLAENSLAAARRSTEYLQGLPQYGMSRRLKTNTLILQAYLEELAGNKGAAEECLAQAIRVSKGSGFFQTFLDEGKELASVFNRLLTKPGTLLGEPDMEEYIRRIIQGLQAETPLPSLNSVPAHDDFQELVEDLSNRELEILTLVERGLSNKDISETLNLSIRTVKWHNSNIFGKLGVSNRTQAVARARQLGLLR